MLQNSYLSQYCKFAISSIIAYYMQTLSIPNKHISFLKWIGGWWVLEHFSAILSWKRMCYFSFIRLLKTQIRIKWILPTNPICNFTQHRIRWCVMLRCEQQCVCVCVCNVHIVHLYVYSIYAQKHFSGLSSEIKNNYENMRSWSS